MYSERHPTSTLGQSGSGRKHRGFEGVGEVVFSRKLLAPSLCGDQKGGRPDCPSDELTGGTQTE